MIDTHAESKEYTLRVNISRLTRSSHRVAWALGQLLRYHGLTGSDALLSDYFRLADKPLIAPLPKEIATLLLDCR